MYEGFERFEIQTSDPEVKIVGRVGGKGPAVLLLHGNPLTHVHWHLVAPRLGGGLRDTGDLLHDVGLVELLDVLFVDDLLDLAGEVALARGRRRRRLPQGGRDRLEVPRHRRVGAVGRDLLDVPLEIGPGAPDMSGVVITLADARSELAGTLGVPAGQTADRYAIVAFTTERTLWRPNGRRLRAVRPAPDGAFSIMDLPAGEYLLAAVEDVPPDDWQQTSFLEQLAAAAVKVTIRDGEKTMQSLRIAK